MWQFGMWTSTSTRTRRSCVSLYKGTHLMCMSSCFGGRCFSPPPSGHPSRWPSPPLSPRSRTPRAHPTHTLTLTRGVTRGSDGAKNNPSCRHKRAGEHTAVCCRKSVCVCLWAHSSGDRALPLSSLTFQAGSSQIWLELEDASLFPSLACSLLWLSLFPWASFLFISSWESCTHRSSLHPLPLSLSPQSLVNIKEMLVRPLPLSPSLSLSRFFLVYTPSSPLPSLFFLTVKAAFQMLISTQSKRERGRVELWLAFG